MQFLTTYLLLLDGLVGVLTLDEFGVFEIAVVWLLGVEGTGVAKEEESGVLGGTCAAGLGASWVVDTGTDGAGRVNKSSATLLRLVLGVSATRVLGDRLKGSLRDCLNFRAFGCCMLLNRRAATNCLWRSRIDLRVNQLSASQSTTRLYNKIMQTIPDK